LTIAHSLNLDYQLQPGWLEPYVQGVLKGNAVARRCKACNKISFPPIRVCVCNSNSGDWVGLSGEARIVSRCDGSDGSFALVQFKGADTLTVVRLKTMAECNRVGYLQTPESGNPALIIAPAGGEHCE